MNQDNWSETLASLISKFTPKQDVARFRNDYSAVLQTIEPREKVSNIRSALLTVRDQIEAWVASKDKCPCCALREWIRLSEGVSTFAPSTFLVTLAKKIPAMGPGDADWQQVFFNTKNKAVLSTFIDRRFVSTRDLESWVTSRLKEAYQLPILDLAIEKNAFSDWASLLSGCMQWGGRQVTLLNRERLLVFCYSSVLSPSADVEFIKFLLRTKESRRGVFLALIEELATGVRFTELLSQEFLRQQRAKSDVSDMLADFVNVCVEQFRDTNPAVAGPALLLASLRLHFETNAKNSEECTRALALIGEAQTSFADSMLHSIAEDHTARYGTCYALLQGTEIHELTHRYLRSLRGQTDESATTGRRSEQMDQFLGKREVLEKVIQALDETEDNEALRDHLEVAMINLGVQSFGKPGEKVMLQSRLHRSRDPGLIPGDEVEIIREGRCLKQGDDMIILTKALVQEA